MIEVTSHETENWASRRRAISKEKCISRSWKYIHKIKIVSANRSSNRSRYRNYITYIVSAWILFIFVLSVIKAMTTLVNCFINVIMIKMTIFNISTIITNKVISSTNIKTNCICSTGIALLLMICIISFILFMILVTMIMTDFDNKSNTKTT